MYDICDQLMGVVCMLIDVSTWMIWHQCLCHDEQPGHSPELRTVYAVCVG